MPLESLPSSPGPPWTGVGKVRAVFGERNGKEQDGLALPLSLPPSQAVGSLPSLSCRRQEALWGVGWVWGSLLAWCLPSCPGNHRAVVGSGDIECTEASVQGSRGQDPSFPISPLESVASPWDPLAHCPRGGLAPRSGGPAGPSTPFLFPAGSPWDWSSEIAA